MFCPKCGWEICYKRDYCPKCGCSLRGIEEKVSEWNSSHKKLEETIDVESQNEFQVELVEIQKGNIEKKSFWKNKKLIAAISSALVILFIIVGIAVFRNSNSVIRNVKFGMTMEEVAKKEKHTGTEGYEYYYVKDADLYNSSCDIEYDFENDILDSICVLYDDDSYDLFCDLYNKMYEEYGEPHRIDISEDGSGSIESAICWTSTDEFIPVLSYIEQGVCIVYFGLSSDDYSLLYSEYGNVSFDESTCSHFGCDNKSLMWSDYCSEHGCFVIGCDEEGFLNNACRSHWNFAKAQD